MQNNEVNRYYRLSEIIGNKKANPPILPIIPVSKSTWWAGVKSGYFPSPIKLSTNITVWRQQDISDFIAKIEKKNIQTNS